LKLSKDDLRPTGFGYKTFKCGNLYAYIMERSLNILKENGRFGMIVPVSAIANQSMYTLQNLLREYKNSHFSTFHQRPAQLFQGVLQRLSILLLSNILSNERTRTFTTNPIRWYADTRNFLFKSIQYNNINQQYNSHYLKSYARIENKIFNKYIQHNEIKNYLVKTINNNLLSYRTAGGGYWLTFLTKAIATESLSNKVAYFDAKYNSNVIMAILNSNLHWWIYYISYDMFNTKDYMIFSFRFNYPSRAIEKKLIELSVILEKDLHLNSEQYIINSKTKGKNETIKFLPSKSKHIIDQIDKVLAEHYGFTDEELDFIINYDIKYRMGNIE
jgi:hypothetical protein